MAKITGANVIKINYNPVCLKECVRIKMVHLEPRKRGICQGWLCFSFSNVQDWAVINPS